MRKDSASADRSGGKDQPKISKVKCGLGEPFRLFFGVEIPLVLWISLGWMVKRMVPVV